MENWKECLVCGTVFKTKPYMIGFKTEEECLPFSVCVRCFFDLEDIEFRAKVLMRLDYLGVTK